jgi:transposase
MELKDEWFRPAAYYLVKVKEMLQKDVAELFGVNRKRVSRAIKRFDETGSNKDCAGRGRKRTARTAAIIQEAADLLQQNSHTKLRNGVSGNSSRKLAAKLEVSQRSALRILHEDLGLKPWKKTERQKLTDAQKRKRLERATELKERFTDGLHRQILFSDEK